MFPIRLKLARNAAGFSQKELASKLYISQQAYAKYELGTSSPNPETIRNIALALNVSTDYLLGQTDIKNPSTETSEGLGENIIVVGRNGEVVKKKLSPDAVNTILGMIELLPEDDNPDL